VRRRLLIALLVAGAAAAAVSSLRDAPTVSTSPAIPTPVESGAALNAWPARAPLGKPRGDLFASPAPPSPVVAAPQAPAKPVAPPMPYRVAGSIVREGVARWLLERGGEVFPVAEGETLEGGYRVESIGADEITLLYLPLGVHQRLPFDTAARVSGPVQMRWEGPERVTAGTPFTVALRVTSGEPLRASPLQVNFDAEVLEPIAVRPGTLFAEGFAYRVGAEGSIFIGASGRGRTANVATDAELVVFVFKPIRPAAATELKLASLLLEGAVGKPVAVEPLSAYRTTITP
jgi:hypothetical protein